MTTTESAFHDGLSFGPPALTVRDREAVSAFYRAVLGLEPMGATEGGDLRLGAGDRALIALRERPDAPLPERRAAGLFHVALLVPGRAELSAVLQRILGAGVPLGSADHGASEAIYISDPEGNGIEIYRDRRPDRWSDWTGGRPSVVTLPLDPRLLRVADAPAGLPPGTIIGHVHLKVNDLDAAVDFYRDALELELTARLPGAAFLAAGGYHHHLGLNTWQSADGAPPPRGAAGLTELRVHRAGAAPATLDDPTGARLEILG